MNNPLTLPSLSGVLQALPPTERPSDDLACARCPMATWMAGPGHLACHCSALHAMTWTHDEPVDIRDCDGLRRALAADPDSDLV